ncbi:MAG TPA: thioredoxin domain-containing protein [Candidatus Solibacter sp.]|jgi:protein-disulfide isomerase|nr:thioredoxin domain-containing protein [Candidatus Solibacter sp.]
MKKLLNSISGLLLVMALCAFSAAADFSSLKPPTGSKVAIVVFEDLECPDCARAYPMVWEAAKSHNIPVVLHDFPLPKHAWSFKAAVYARFFDTKSQKIGDDFRGYIYKNQPQITADNLDQFARKYADDNKIPLPFAIDPQGKLKEKVQADYDLGQRIGLEHTPTIYVVGNGGVSQPVVDEVKDRAQLTQMIEDMQKKVSAATVVPAKRAAAKPHKKPS